MSLLKLFVLVCGTFCLFLLLIYFSFSSISSLRFVNPGRTALMLERGGGVQQTWVPLSRISPVLRRAVVVAEDGNFYQHRGIDLHEMRESFKKNLSQKKFARGFSTITMQVVKNLYLSQQKTISRKILEMLLALRMEQSLSKDRILEIYLNIIEWGKEIYGAEAASEFYFNKPAKALSPREAAFLAAILPNPEKWGRWPPGPYVNRRLAVILARLGLAERPTPEVIEIPELPDEGPTPETENLPQETAAPETEGSPPP